MKRARLKRGDAAPDFELEDIESRRVRLSRVARPVALIFLRHLA